MKKAGLYIFIFSLLLLAGCSGLKHVPADELLYTGYKIKVVTNEKIEKTGPVKTAAGEVVRPAPNTSFLGWRPALWLYYVVKQPKKEKSLRGWLRNKVAQQPVYLSAMDLPLIQKGIDASLYNNGFLDSYSEYEVHRSKKKRTAAVTFVLHLRKPYTINNISFPPDTSHLSALINQAADKTLLKKGDRYNLDVLVKERARIDDYLKELSYYYFNPNYILFAMDTAHGNRTVNLYTTIKNTMPEKAGLVYRIGRVNVYPDYQTGNDTMATRHLVIDSIHYYRQSKYIRARTVVKNIFFRPDSIYSRRVHQVTLSRLNGLGVFKFLNVSIDELDTLSRGRLLVNIYLNPLPRKSLGLEAQMVTKSNNFIGPAFNISFRNRNAFRGAELVIYNLKASFETQYSGQYKGLFTYQVNPRIELNIPRFIPRFKVKRSNLFVPRTRFSLDYGYLSRVGYFDMNSFKLGIGYKWKQKIEIDHDLTLLNIDYYNVYNTTDKFDALVKDNLLIRRRFEMQFLAGVAYSFYYNQQLLPVQKNQFYFNGNTELSGNTLSLLGYLATKSWGTSAYPARVLGVKFAQFARFDIDVRDYVRLRHDNMLAFRVIAGWGLPYGNSSTLPYSKQFFAGGAYSLRGFPANSVGPGSYAPPDSIKNVFYQQQGGEIKLEANAEFRFPIFKILKGAVFLDAGNVWLNKANADAPNGEIHASKILKEMALSTGAGLRLDVSFFVLRLDVGIPLRNPALPEGNRWIIEDLKFKNVIFNLAFGYPF